MSHTRKCAGCGREISAYTARCAYCGRARPVRCTECKKVTHDGSSCCTHCGAPLPDPARIPKSASTNRPAASWAVENTKEERPPIRTQTPDMVAPWKAALILGVSLLVVLFVLYTAFMSRRARRQRQGLKKVHLLWDKAKALAELGDVSGAHGKYNEALSEMRRSSLNDPVVRTSIERELKELQPKPKKDLPKPKPSPLEDLKKKGGVVHFPLAFLTKPPTTYFYTGRQCIDMWVKVANVGKKSVDVSRSAFEAHFDDGKVLPVADVYEAFHLPEKALAPAETISGSVLFGALANDTPGPKHLKEVTYAGKTIWKRPSAPRQP